jgi:hypothetical protein
MRVYLWVAGSSEGVTDDQDQARRLAARFLLENGAAQAVVEPADLDLSSLDHGYERIAGRRWTASRQGSQVDWASRRVPAPGHQPLRAAS